MRQKNLFIRSATFSWKTCNLCKEIEKAGLPLKDNELRAGMDALLLRPSKNALLTVASTLGCSASSKNSLCKKLLIGEFEKGLK